MNTTLHYIIEGVDRLGKNSVIDEIQNKLGFHHVIHYAKPKQLDFYAIPGSSKSSVLQNYQQASFHYGFSLLNQTTVPMIYNRSHIGEAVYSSRYRGYSGEYVFVQERQWRVEAWHHVRLVLLTTSDFSFIVDDGESFDFAAKEEEQHDFITAFNKSEFSNKVMIDVHNGSGSFRSREDILDEVINKRV